MQRNLQLFVDPERHATAIILLNEEDGEIVEDLRMGRAARERKGESRRPFEEAVKELCAAGEIGV
jgi:hypothetical protein